MPRPGRIRGPSTIDKQRRPNGFDSAACHWPGRCIGEPRTVLPAYQTDTRISDRELTLRTTLPVNAKDIRPLRCVLGRRATPRGLIGHLILSTPGRSRRVQISPSRGLYFVNPCESTTHTYQSRARRIGGLVNAPEWCSNVDFSESGSKKHSKIVTRP